MPALARVIENNVKSNGTIKTKLSVSARAEKAAVGKAKSAALRHNGYADVVLSSRDNSVEVGSIRVVGEREIGLRKTYIITVVTTGIGPRF